MFSRRSRPPAHSGTLWSTWKPRQGPRCWAVAGHACSARNARTSAADRGNAQDGDANAMHKATASRTSTADDWPTGIPSVGAPEASVVALPLARTGIARQLSVVGRPRRMRARLGSKRVTGTPRLGLIHLGAARSWQVFRRPRACPSTGSQQRHVQQFPASPCWLVRRMPFAQRMASVVVLAVSAELAVKAGQLEQEEESVQLRQGVAPGLVRGQAAAGRRKPLP